MSSFSHLGLATHIIFKKHYLYGVLLSHSLGHREIDPENKSSYKTVFLCVFLGTTKIPYFY